MGARSIWLGSNRVNKKIGTECVGVDVPIDARQSHINALYII
nr:MAG TPA: hypothetical protein [Caudoviricetes sp.]